MALKIIDESITIQTVVSNWGEYSHTQSTDYMGRDQAKEGICQQISVFLSLFTMR